MSAQSLYTNLLEPLDLGPVRLRNRIVSTAHQTGLVHAHLPTEAFADYHEARARGGAAMIVIEATAVHPTGLLTSDTLGGYLEPAAEAFGEVALRVHRHGGVLLAQLFHGGREQIMSPPRKAAVAPSAVPTERFHTEPRALSEWEIEEIIAGYATCARTMADAGLDGVEVSAAHRYLIAQFFDPATNRRDDRWRDGGLLLERILAAVRSAAPELMLGVRVTATAAEAAEIASRLADVDYLSVTFGDASTLLGAVGIVPPPPFPRDALDSASRPFHALPLIGTGRVFDLAAADQLVRSGRLDLVGMTRALIADPDLPRKAADGGRGVRRCTGCNVCIAHYHAGEPIACMVNPLTGRERSFPRPPDLSGRSVVVIGAGPAGLAAASTALEAGAAVTLFEQSHRIGGQAAIAGSAPGQRETVARFLANFDDVRGSERLKLCLGSSPSAEDVEALHPDLVVVATGARPIRPALPDSGIEVLTSWEVLDGARVGKRVVIADWGGDPSGVDCADLLCEAGHDVSLVVGSHAVGEALHPYRRALYMARLHIGGVDIVHHLRLRAIVGDAVEFENIYEPRLTTRLQAESLVLALGREPADELINELGHRGLRVVAAGDCIGPRSMEEAVLEGTLALSETVDERFPAPMWVPSARN